MAVDELFRPSSGTRRTGGDNGPVAVDKLSTSGPKSYGARLDDDGLEVMG